MERTSSTRPYAPAVLDIPDWLSAPTAPAGANLPMLTPKEMREMTDMAYAAFFETVLEKVASGTTLADIVREDERYDITKYRAWVMTDPERKHRYYSARTIGAEMIEDQMIKIADAINPDGTSSMEDVQRSNLRITTRKWLLGVWDKQRYGSSHQIEVKNNNPMREDSLEALASRLQSLRRQPSGDVVDVTSREST